MTIPTMRPSGVPFQDMCTMIGLMTISWAWAETSLAMTIGIIQENLGPIKGYTEAPVSASKKVECIKAALKQFEVLEPFKEKGMVLAKLFKELSSCRNEFIHGAASEAREGGFQSTNLKVISGKYTGKDHRFQISDALALNAKIYALSDDITQFMINVATAVTS